MSKHANNSTPSKASRKNKVQGNSQRRMPLTRRPGAAKRATKRATRRSKGERGFRKFWLDESFISGLEPILFHPPVERAAAEAKRIRCLTDIALKTLQRFTNQNRLHRFQTQFLEILCLGARSTQSQIGGLDLPGAAHQYRALEGMFQLTDVPGPGILH